jgi:hypothetical protein
MTKFTNPFYTIDEAIEVLKSLGAKPMSNPFRYDESSVHWPEHIIGIQTSRVYDVQYKYHFEVEIHVDREGLDALVQMTGLNIMREPHLGILDALTVRPGTLLKVFALEAKEESK